ncbi:Fanconi anemia core complex-associated protein 100 [Mixophyes fleayi]|uniref:Fanconi anemia core complex-associated protein 100 n=1 Tax=Mixophyes fleayi TaxID=3061075 RepID=UPI003F4D9789
MPGPIVGMKRTGCTMTHVEHLAQFQCPSGGLSRCKGQVIYWNKHVYVCNGSRFVYIFSMEKKQITAAYLFPSKVWHIELVTCTQQLYVLCAQNGLYLLEWDEQGRLLMEANTVISKVEMTIYHIGSNFGCLLDSSICSFTVAYDFLVIILVQLDKWKVKLFHRKSLHCEDPNTSPSREVKFSLTFEKETSDMQPVLCCVSLWKEKTVNGIPCNFALEASLFTRLFGVDFAMLETPMILCGFPDGQVICFPLKITGSSYMHLSETHSSSQSFLKLLYHLDQPLVSIGATRMEPCDLHTEQPIRSSENLACDCLMFIGQKGLIVAVTTGDISEGIACAFKDYRLPTPVCCALYSVSGVYCSTFSDIIFVTIPCTEKVASSTTPTCSIVSSFRHNIPMIVAVSQNTSLSDELLVLSNRGRLMLYKLYQRGSRDLPHGLGCADAGKRIKQLLSGIGSMSERVSQLKSVVYEKNRSLTKLNQVISLSREVLSVQWTECPVHCVIRVSWTQMLQKDCLTAYCNLENKTHCVIERGWTLCILISTDPSTSYSFPMALKPGEKKELTFPLTIHGCDSLDFPIQISCTLFYSLKGLFAECGIATDSSISYSDKQDVSIHLQEHAIDMLQCLRFSPQAGFPSPSGPSWTFTENAVQAFLKTTSGGESNVDQSETVPKAVCNQEVDLTMPLKALVRVSSLLLTQALQNEKSGRPLCSATLHWLLSAEWTKIHNLVEIQGVSPDGRKFCLRVQEVSVSNLSSDGNIPAIEVQILSSHLHVVASLHLAVINRFKILLQQNNGCHSLALNLGNIQQQFSAYELLLKEVKTLREHLCVAEDTISSAAAQRLLHIYRELREMPSLLFI